MSEKICYCFDYTIDDIRDDVMVRGRSTILERIIAEKKKGGCKCKTINPKGV